MGTMRTIARWGTGRWAAILVLSGDALVPSPAPAQNGPDWCPEPEARQFDFWIGEWDVENQNSAPGSAGWSTTGSATNRVYAVVGGCAIVEHWRGYAFPAAGHIVGFSVRAWDPGARQWEIVLLWPMGSPPRFGTSAGRFEDGRGVFRNRFATPAGDAVVSRLDFYDITDTAFVWSNGVSRDEGETWTSSWIMEFTRRSRLAPGLWNGPAMTTAHCPGEEHRTFDRHLGEWAGVRTHPDGDSTAVRTHLARILEGCAVMERTWTEDGAWEEFSVRAYEPGEDRWVEYVVASDRRRLHRREFGTASTDGVLVVVDAEPVNGTYRRTRWTLGNGSIRRLEESAAGPDGLWREVSVTRFTARVGRR